MGLIFWKIKTYVTTLKFCIPNIHFEFHLSEIPAFLLFLGNFNEKILMFGFRSLNVNDTKKVSNDKIDIKHLELLRKISNHAYIYTFSFSLHNDYVEINESKAKVNIKIFKNLNCKKKFD